MTDTTDETDANNHERRNGTPIDLRFYISQYLFTYIIGVKSCEI